MNKTMSSLAMELLVQFSSGDFAFSGELQAFWMAVQGAMMVRLGPNKDRSLNWFHAFSLSVIGGFGGGWLGFIWMGRPSSMLSNDLNMASCIVAFILVNYTPMDIGFKCCNNIMGKIATVVFAQLFRSLGVAKFVMVCFETFKDSPSAYYPIPVFGPILYATLLGNMGGFVLKGFNGHLANGMPWPVQNGLFCATFYHFYVNDQTGPIGIFLRKSLRMAHFLGFKDNQTFALVVVTMFMQVMGILQMPTFLGPSFTPFGSAILSPFRDSSTWKTGEKDTAYSTAQAEKKKRRRGKGTVKTTSARIHNSKDKQS